MASQKVQASLSELEDASTPQAKRPTGYQALLDEVVSQSEPSQRSNNVIAVIKSILKESLGIAAARPLLNASIGAIKSLPVGEKIDCGTTALSILQPRVVSFEEQDALLRELLADAYQDSEDFLEAAKMLQGIQLDSSQRQIPDKTRVMTWMRICRLYLEEDDTVNAETYLNRAKNLLYKVNDTELELSFQLSQARILDSNRRFLDASSVYHSFSFSGALDEDERLRALSSAIICAVLAPAGPPRSRTLGKLYKDERSPRLEEFGILEKMFLDRLLSPDEVEKFASKLAPHQLAQTADGSTVLAKAVIQHNLLGVSRLYQNIKFDELAVLLGLDAEKAEEYAANMLEQGRLNGHIDQIDGVIFFDRIGGSSRKAPKNSARNLREWDLRVQGITEEVERVASLLQTHAPVNMSTEFLRRKSNQT